MTTISAIHQMNSPILKTLHPVKVKLCISTTEGHEIIAKHEINYVKADSNYSIINHSEKNMLCTQTLSEISTRIRLDNFIRIHRSYLVNIDKVKSFSSSFDRLTMEDGTSLPISRTKKKLIKSRVALFCD